jgi:D-serine deaminase-like pyridoxal phosphate-dependent protein
MALDEVETPALIIDLDAMERNLRMMAEAVQGTQVKLRPHAKMHKSPDLARLQLAQGAVGVCCQKVSEAEAMVRGGVPDVLVSNEIVGDTKLARLAALAREARVAVCADDPFQVERYSAAAQAFGVTLPVLVEVDVGAHRCGVAPGPPVADLAKRIERAPGLRFAGLQAYQGSAQHKRQPAERREAIQSAVAQIRESVQALGKAGLACDWITGAGTGTFRHEIASGLYTELQVGSYLFMDADYARNVGEDGKPVHEFEHALFVLATVISRPVPERAVVDAGLKAYTTESGLPVVHGLPGVECVRVSDEHGVLQFSDPSHPLKVGERVMLIPGHCDPTVNLHDWYVGVRKRRVEALWPITARGAVS